MNKKDIIDINMELEKQYLNNYKDKNENQLFPRDWYSIEDFELTAEILKEELEKKTTISETELYKKVHDDMVNKIFYDNLMISVNNRLNKKN